MNAKERFITALGRGKADRLPVTTHHVMPSFLESHLDGISNDDFFNAFGLDPIQWVMAYRYSPERGEYFDPGHTEMGFLEARRVCSDQWRIILEPMDSAGYTTQRFRIVTPKGSLSMVLQSNEHTTWLAEHLVKEKADIDLIAKYMTFPLCNVEEVNEAAEAYGNRGLIRGHIPAFEGFGQPGCWQDAACLFGAEKLIIAVLEDPVWVHEFLGILMRRKKTYIESLKGAKYDLLELGGGDASTTVISPDIFNEFVAPYDSRLIEAAHEAGQRIVYHTCGGMMPILEDIAAMGPDAMETFTPLAMGGDVNLKEAKKRIGNRVCMIGGFDQFHFFKGCTEEQTRKEVRRCFEEAGEGGGYILSPSDHFFEADLHLLSAFADEAVKCYY
ncbi:MAG: uroporphyrinogen decarboxylase family protein [Bacteroidales bacterium]